MNKHYFKLLLACIGLIAALFSTSAVMADSIVLTNPATGHKYQAFDSMHVSWTTARDYCKNIVNPAGGYLATITSQAENDFILKTLTTYGNGNYWIGASDAQQQGVWKWVTTTEKFSYTNWSTNEPNIANGQYVYINRYANGADDHWHVSAEPVSNYGGWAFICEWGGAAYKDYVGSASLSDMNANNFPEIATLYTDDATGKVTVQIKDGSTKAVINAVVFGKPKTSFPKSITVLSDMNANGFQEIAVLLIDNITLKATQEIRDASTGALISSVPF